MRIALLGDVALFGKYSIPGNPKIKYYLSQAKEFLKDFDYVVANLETPIIQNGKPYGAKSAYIASDPININILKDLNINVVNLANNHIFDYGPLGYCSTVLALSEVGIQYFGIEGKALEIKSGDDGICLHGYCSYNTNPLGIYKGRGIGVNPLNIEKIALQMEIANKKGLLNILSIHSGFEHINYPSLDDIDMARKLSKISDYVYYGHHPHVIQGVEEYNKSLIAYSLGNFLFDDVFTKKSDKPLIQQTIENKTGLIIGLDIKGKDIENYKLVTCFMDNHVMTLDGEEGIKKIRSYSVPLVAARDEYENFRRKLIDEYINDRKNMRNIGWYIKRLKWSSVEMIIRARWNKFQYKKNVTTLLGKL